MKLLYNDHTPAMNDMANSKASASDNPPKSAECTIKLRVQQYTVNYFGIHKRMHAKVAAAHHAG